jgi:hypothetical protein
MRLTTIDIENQDFPVPLILAVMAPLPLLIIFMEPQPVPPTFPAQGHHLMVTAGRYCDARSSLKPVLEKAVGGEGEVKKPQFTDSTPKRGLVPYINISSECFTAAAARR